MTILNLTILVAKSDVFNSSVFKDSQIQACKTFMALATGVKSTVLGSFSPLVIILSMLPLTRRIQTHDL